MLKTPGELSIPSPLDAKSARRIVIVADWLPPDFGAVGQYMQLRARALAEQGLDVTLVGLSSKAASVRVMEAGRTGRLTQVRLKSRSAPRSSLVARMLWTIWTDLRLVIGAFASMRSADGILFTGSPPFLVHLLVPLRFLLKGKLVYRITDFHPECSIAERGRPSKSLELLLALTKFWRRRVDWFEVLGEDQLKRLQNSGIPRARIDLVRDASPVSFEPGQQPERRPVELAGRCVLLYSGNYGVAHEVETVADGYRRHHRWGTGRVLLWLSAAGIGADELVRRFSAEKLPFHRSPPVPLERLASLLVAPDAHLIALRDSFVGFVMPSKVYACLDSQKPILFVGSKESDVDLLARRANNHYCRIDCGDIVAFSEALEALADLQQGISRSKGGKPL